MTFPIAISPCPNDTFLFYAWIHGLVGKELMPLPTYADIEQLNNWALEQKYPLIKVSFACFAKLQKTYRLLSVGAAIGENCGPKIISRIPFPLEEIAEKVVALPGKETTAHLLFNHLAPSPKKKLFCLYHETQQLLNSQAADCGIIIHESRFTYQKEGFHEIADLGTLWQRAYGLPLPLGGLALLRNISAALQDKITKILSASLRYARAHPEECNKFISSLSQVKDTDVIKKHISLYVNQETEELSSRGQKAIQSLLNFSAQVPEKRRTLSSPFFWNLDW